MCDPCCLIVGCTPKQERIDKPEHYDNLPREIYCPHCSIVSKPVYKREKQIFTLCFIPLWPCGKSDPYVACENCNGHVGMIRGGPCRSCQISMPFDCDYCPNCGTKRSMGESRVINAH